MATLARANKTDLLDLAAMLGLDVSQAPRRVDLAALIAPVIAGKAHGKGHRDHEGDVI